MINVQNIVKDYKSSKSHPGLLGSIKGLFSNEYETKRAVDNISFHIPEGEMVGFLGPNGAGKSTTIKMLTGILVPTSGVVTVNGINPYTHRKDNARQIGVVFGQKTQLWWDVPVIESLKLLRDIYKVDQKDFKRNIELFSDLLDLDSFMNIPLRQLSLGQRMRADISASLLHNPNILFLDEPTIGIDIIAKDKLRNFVKEINKERKVTVILTTHDMDDVVKLCSRMIIIDRGQMIFDDEVSRASKQIDSHKVLIVELEHETNTLSIPNYVEILKDYGRVKHIKYNPDLVPSSELINYISSNHSILDLKIEEHDIEEVVKSIYINSANKSEVI